MEDELLTSLRTAAGIDLTRIHNVYGSEYERAVRRGAREAIELGLAVVEEGLKLTDPDGFPVLELRACCRVWRWGMCCVCKFFVSVRGKPVFWIKFKTLELALFYRQLGPGRRHALGSGEGAIGITPAS